VRKVILDCDPGHDDAIAILLAAGNPDLDIVAITVVAGNQTLDHVTQNARSIAELAGLTDTPLAAGCAQPLIRDAITADDVHGETGMDGPETRAPSYPVDPRHAVDVIIETINADPGVVTLIPTGPLTNIAMAVRKAPEIVGRVQEVVLMGGAIGQGNVTPAAEFNIAADPEAAQIVFNAGWPVTMVGLDVTHTATATPDVLDQLAALDTEVSRFVLDLLEFFGERYRDQGFKAPPVHDVCAVAAVADPNLLTCRPAPIHVETMGHLTAGMTVVDLRHGQETPVPTQVAIDIDTDRLWTLLLDALGRLEVLSSHPRQADEGHAAQGVIGRQTARPGRRPTSYITTPRAGAPGAASGSGEHPTRSS